MFCLSNIHFNWTSYFFFKILFIYERHRERGRDIGGGRSRLPLDIGLMQDSSRDQGLSQRQMFNH